MKHWQEHKRSLRFISQSRPVSNETTILKTLLLFNDNVVFVKLLELVNE